MRLAEQLRYLVLAAQLEGRRRLARALKPLNLTPSQAEVLRVLDDHGAMSLRSLGKLLVCETGTNPSRLVDRLVERALVDRREDEHDARAVILCITKEGRKLSGDVRRLEESMYQQLDKMDEGDARATVRFLRSYVAGSPVGTAFLNRESLQPKRGPAWK
ncbi:MAG: MarR family transcriptional regulator [Sandaracinus sp.]